MFHVLFCSDNESRFTENIQFNGSVLTGSHLDHVVFHTPHNGEVEAGAKAVLEEDGGTAAVEAALRDDGHPVAQQVSLVHVVGGHDHRSPCKRDGRFSDAERRMYTY